MSADTTLGLGRPAARLRVDHVGHAWDLQRLALPAVFVAAAVGFVIIGGGNLDLGPDEAKIGLSAVEPIGPFGQSLGGWEPSIWVGAYLPSKLWYLASGMWESAIVRWPAVIAAIVTALIVVRTVRTKAGVRMASLCAVTWFGSIAMMDRSGDAGLDLIAGMGTILAVNRLLAGGASWTVGLFASWAFLAGGWPPLAMIGLTSILLGRSGASINYKVIIPVVLTVVGWSAWALATTRAEVWAAALTLPLTKSSAWMMAATVLGLGLPWSPFAALAFSPSIRDQWKPEGRAYLVGWGQVAIASLIAGTVIPGFATAATMTALAGLSVVAAASLDATLQATLTTKARVWLAFAAITLAVLWTVFAVVWGVQLALNIAYYRAISITLIALAIGLVTIVAASSWLGDRRGQIASLILLAVSFKLAHFGHHVPEWNYRHSQAPWGRAIGQWLPRSYPVHVLHAWPTDLVFAIERPVRHIVDPRLLPDRPGPSPKFILLLASEFEHWQTDKWPKIVPVARFQDEVGEGRVLARTEGEFSWRKAATEAAAED